MGRRVLRGTLVAALVAGSLTLGPRAEAAGRPVGLRVSVTSVVGLTVNFDVTLYTNYVFTANTPNGLLGNLFVTPFFFSYTGTLINPVINAVDYGDGSIIPGQVIPAVGAGVYRGSFSHAYAAPATYTITGGASGPYMGYLATNTVTQGNPVAATAGGYSVYSPFAGTTLYFTFGLAAPYVVGITNTASAVITAVPAMPLGALWALAALFLATGVFLLRRGGRGMSSAPAG